MTYSHMIHPARWREGCDPFALNYHSFQINEVLGYPHAGNDVFYVRGAANGNETNAYIKVARQKSADIDNEVNLLTQLNDPVFPKVLDYDCEHGTFLVTEEMPGLRLSALVGDNVDLRSLAYMEVYGEALARVHQMNISAKMQADRKFRHCPDAEILKKLNLQFLSDYFKRKPLQEETVFCHGDFHYANLLWEEQHISAILDFELAGYGNRDFDIAWALFLRPGQKFLKTDKELELFIKGYQKYRECNVDAVKYYMAQCYVHFLCFCEEREYCEYVRNWLEDNCTCFGKKISRRNFCL